MFALLDIIVVMVGLDHKLIVPLGEAQRDFQFPNELTTLSLDTKI